MPPLGARVQDPNLALGRKRANWEETVLRVKPSLYPDITASGKEEVMAAYPEVFTVPDPIPPGPQAETLFGPDSEFQGETEGRKRLSTNLTQAGYGWVLAADPGIARALAVYQHALEQSGKGDLLRRHGVFEMARMVNWSDQFADLALRAHKLGPAFDADWRMLCDLRQMSSYASPDDSFEDEVEAWVTKPAPLWHPDGFDVAFRAKADTVVDRLLKFTPTLRGTLDEYTRNPNNWALSGSSLDPEGRRFYVQDIATGRRYATGKNKWATAFASSPHEIKARILKRERQFAKGIPKRERKKVRGVISSDVNTYLKMAYVSWAWLDDALKGNEESTLWMSPAQLYEMWERLSRFGPNPRMPIDQTGFDHHVWASHVLYVISRIASKAKGLPGPEGEDIREVLDLILYALSGGWVEVNGKRFPYLAGILSGWKWTAFLDTVINIIQREMAEDLVRRAGLPYPIFASKPVSQGDDIQTEPSDWLAGAALWAAYEIMGFDVHPNKFWLDTGRDEFLRRVMIQGEVTGYPARAVGAILERNPIGEIEAPGEMRLNETWSRWNTLFARLGGHPPSWLVYEDLAKGNKLTTTSAIMWAHSPGSLGGGGLFPLANPAVRVSSAEREVRGVKPVDAPGIDALVDVAVARGLAVTSDDVWKWGVGNVKLPSRLLELRGAWTDPGITLHQWEWVRPSLRGTPPKPPALDPEQKMLLQTFPSRESCIAFGVPRPAGTSLRWWIDYLCGTLPKIGYHPWGYDPGYASYVTGPQSLAVNNWFYFQDRRPMRLIESALATAESLLLRSGESALNMLVTFRP